MAGSQRVKNKTNLIAPSTQKKPSKILQRSVRLADHSDNVIRFLNGCDFGRNGRTARISNHVGKANIIFSKMRKAPPAGGRRSSLSRINSFNTRGNKTTALSALSYFPLYPRLGHCKVAKKPDDSGDLCRERQRSLSRKHP